MLVYEYNSTSSQPVQNNLSCCKIPYVIAQDIEHGCRREEASAPHADVEEEEDVEDFQGDLSFPFDQNTFFDGLIELPTIQTTISLEVEQAIEIVKSHKQCKRFLEQIWFSINALKISQAKGK